MDQYLANVVVLVNKVFSLRGAYKLSWPVQDLA